jgi:hypothetical protein
LLKLMLVLLLTLATFVLLLLLLLLPQMKLLHPASSRPTVVSSPAALVRLLRSYIHRSAAVRVQLATAVVLLSLEALSASSHIACLGLIPCCCCYCWSKQLQQVAVSSP